MGGVAAGEAASLASSPSPQAHGLDGTVAVWPAKPLCRWLPDPSPLCRSPSLQFPWRYRRTCIRFPRYPASLSIIALVSWALGGRFHRAP